MPEQLVAQRLPEQREPSSHDAEEAVPHSPTEHRERNGECRHPLGAGMSEVAGDPNRQPSQQQTRNQQDQSRVEDGDGAADHWPVNQRLDRLALREEARQQPREDAQQDVAVDRQFGSHGVGHDDVRAVNERIERGDGDEDRDRQQEQVPALGEGKETGGCREALAQRPVPADARDDATQQTPENDDLQHADTERNPLDQVTLRQVIGVVRVVRERVQHTDSEQSERGPRLGGAAVAGETLTHIEQASVDHLVEGGHERATGLPLDLGVGHGLGVHEGQQVRVRLRERVDEQNGTDRPHVDVRGPPPEPAGDPPQERPEECNPTGEYQHGDCGVESDVLTP